MKIKTSELTGAALDWAVAKCEHDDLAALNIQYPEHAKHYPKVSPSTNWAQGGPIIERREISIRHTIPAMKDSIWQASPSVSAKGAGGKWGKGPTPLIAAMRCFVASTLGDEIEIPDELTR